MSDSPWNLKMTLRAQDYFGAIDELIDELVSRNFIKSAGADSIREGVKKRESVVSSVIKDGIYLPHSATEWVTNPVLAIGTAPEGIDVRTADGNPIRAIVLFLVPKGEVQKHIHTLANIAKLLRKDDFLSSEFS